jgi:hypothetical protein
LRLEYEDRENDVTHTQLFVMRDDMGIAALADKWHAALVTTGFDDLPVSAHDETGNVDQ